MLLTLLCFVFGAVSGSPAVTYARDIAPIVAQNCAVCHRSEGGAPFLLQTYQDAKRHARQIAQVTQSRFMPPWKPEPGKGAFQGDRHLTEEQIDLFRKWFESGAEPGDLADAPKPPAVSSDWQFGKPDLVLKLPAPFIVPADGPDFYASFILPMERAGANRDSTIPQWIRSVEFRLGEQNVIRHAVLFVDTRNETRQLRQQFASVHYTPRVGPSMYILGQFHEWTPGAVPIKLDGDSGMAWLPSQDLVLMLRFHPSGKRETVQPEIGLTFAPSPLKRLWTGIPLGSKMLDLAAGEKQHVLTDTFILPIDVEVVAITPRAHHVCKEISVTATLPDGATLPLLAIKDWDANWQETYVLMQPLSLPAGTRLDMTALYDNSAANLRNQNAPPARVMSGMAYANEMEGVWLQSRIQREDFGKLRGVLKEKITHSIH